MISGHSPFPLMRLLPFGALLPGAWEGRQCAEATPVPARGQRRACSSPPEMVWAAHTSALGGGMVTMTSWAREPKHSGTSFEAALGRNGRSQQGVQLHYVISFLGVRGPGAAAQHCGERLGEGEAAFVPSFAASPPDLGQPPRQAGAAFQVPQLQAGTSQQGLRTRKGCLLSECVKQRPAGFPGRKPGSGLRTRHLGAGAKGERPGTLHKAHPCPQLPAPHALPTSS